MAWKLYFYLAKEILSLTALILAAVSVVMFLFRLLGYADYIFVSQEGVASILMFILFLLPSIFKMTLPISLLLATTIVFIRMSTDRELEAWLSVGVGPLRLAVTPVAVGLIVGCFSGYMSLFVEPFARQEWRKFKYLHARKSVETLLESSLQEKTFLSDLFQTGRSEVALYVDRLDDSRRDMEGVFLSLNQTDEPYSMLLLAQTGTLQKTSDEGLSDFVLTLNNGRFLQPSRKEKTDRSSPRAVLDPSFAGVKTPAPLLTYDRQAYSNPGGDGPVREFVGPPKPPGYTYPTVAPDNLSVTLTPPGGSRAPEPDQTPPSSTPVLSQKERNKAEGLPKDFISMEPVRNWSVTHFSEMRISLMNLFSRRFDATYLDEVDMRSLYPRQYVRELRKLRKSEEWGKNQRFVRDHSFFYEQIVVPLSCLLLPLVGLCLGIQDPRRKAGFAYLGLGGVVFVFYTSIMVCQRMALKFFVPPEVSLIFPPLVLAGLTGVLLYWRNKYPPSVSFFEFLKLCLPRRRIANDF